MDIEKKRKEKTPLGEHELSDFKKEVNEIRKHLERFKEEFDREGVPEHERNEVLADYWNNMGIVEWYLAVAVAEESERERIEYGHHGWSYGKLAERQGFEPWVQVLARTTV
ncbi:MAG: hypothetical protein WAM69_08690 [Candidatus Sulfotelmatobacter sp.]